MKTIFLAVLVGWPMANHCRAADAHPGRTPRFPARVTCFNGELDSGSYCSSANAQPDGKRHAQGKMTCGFPQKVSEIEWTLVGQRGDRDVYRFTRRFPSDTATPRTATNTVEFSSRRVVVFQDKFQAIVIEPPKQ